MHRENISEDRDRDWVMQIQFKECQGLLGAIGSQEGFFPRTLGGSVTLLTP